MSKAESHTPKSVGLYESRCTCIRGGAEMKEGPTMLMKTKGRLRMVPLY